MRPTRRGATDVRRGRSSILVSDSNEAVAALNVRARAERILDGDIYGNDAR